MFALKPAPVQVSWLGYFATTGVAEIDYLIADPWTLPESEEINFTEKIWRLPETRLCFTVPDVVLEVAPLPAIGSGYITFACFNNLTKMNDAVVALWARVLAAVPNSRLFLKAKQLNIEAVRQSTFERFAAHGIAAERLILEGPAPRAEYLAAYQRVDIALDPFPYTGGTTTAEALWMGVPVLTLAGKSFLSRQGVGLLMNTGLSEWVAEDHDDYIARAVSHASDLQVLSLLRGGLRQQVLASPIFDAQRFAEHFEAALRGMWQAWCADNASSSVQPGMGVSQRETVCVPIVNNVYVNVPASSKYMTTFILQEQHDWFEDEIKFVRHFMKPGMRVVDIGANYGVYTLSIAKIVGDGGRVWAFEPTEATANCLSSSISRNEFVNVELIRAGLSDRCGEARFFTSSNSELNSLSQVATGSDQFETIELQTLDSCCEKFGWDHIDFIKLDAEGEEVNILKGAQAFLSSASPLIMYELKHGSSINLPLINSFDAMGYESYRLLPALNILVPFDQHQAFDGYLLNLFACKQDRANQLERDGVLVKRWQEKLESNSANTAAFIASSAFGNALGSFVPSGGESDSEIYSTIVDSYLLACSVREDSAGKVGYLMGALSGVLRMVSQGEQSVVRLITFSRIAFAAGERALGVGLLSTVIDKYFAGIDFDIKGPLLPATEKYDNLSPEGRLKAWVISSALEQWLNKSAFSVYFAGQAALRHFSELNKLGFMDDELKRRYQLLQANSSH
jgi:FkbM family methyltransferase